MEYNELLNRITTIDGEVINKQTYDTVSFYLCKGLLHSNDVKEYEEVRKEYLEKVGELSYIIRKYADHYNEQPKKLLQEAINLQDEIAITKFKKVLECCNMLEKQEVIKQFIENIDLLRPRLTTDKLEIALSERVFSNGHFRVLLERTYY